MPTKASELREVSTEELHEKVEELKAELFNLRFQKATGRLDNYKRLREVRKELARTLTVIRERELGIECIRRAEEPERRRRRKLFRRRPVEEEVEERPEEEEALDEEEGEDEEVSTDQDEEVSTDQEDK